jgi:hypothetical protein
MDTLKIKEIGKVNIVKELSSNFTKIVHADAIKDSTLVSSSKNGWGWRIGGQTKFNYTLIYGNGSIKNYSMDLDNSIPDDLFNNFIKENGTTKKEIIGVFFYSEIKENFNRPIKESILNEIRSKKCVSCGTNSEIICDHKNDLYNDPRVLDTKTQLLSDFQPLCNHCNLQKRQIAKQESEYYLSDPDEAKVYAIKDIWEKYKIYPFEFTWENKKYNPDDIECKVGTYWYDPVEFEKNILNKLLSQIKI